MTPIPCRRVIRLLLVTVFLAKWTVVAQMHTEERIQSSLQSVRTAAPDSISVSDIHIGSVNKGINFFSARVRNHTDQDRLIGLDLRAMPGFWLRNWQDQVIFHIRPLEEKTVEAAFVFPGITSEASLRVILGYPELDRLGFIKIKDSFFTRFFAVGKDRTDDEVLSRFERYDTDHFEIFTYRGYLPEIEVDRLSRIREKGYTDITEWLSAEYPSKIRLFLFPDEAVKRRETGHRGLGWAFSNNIVEVYNDSTRLDPFHELTHILMERLGNPPALFNEGLAVYMSEKLGADALKYLRNPGRKIHAVVRGYMKEKKTVPLDTLFTYTEIGSAESNAVVAYPQSASVVKYLIETHGFDKFREAFVSLKSSRESAVIAQNKRLFRQIYDKSLSAIEAGWLASIQ